MNILAISTNEVVAGIGGLFTILTVFVTGLAYFLTRMSPQLTAIAEQVKGLTGRADRHRDELQDVQAQITQVALHVPPPTTNVSVETPKI